MPRGKGLEGIARHKPTASATITAALTAQAQKIVAMAAPLSVGHSHSTPLLSSVADCSQVPDRYAVALGHALPDQRAVARLGVALDAEERGRSLLRHCGDDGLQVH